MDIQTVQKAINSFLQQRVDKRTEAEKKKLKDSFTAEHAAKINAEYEPISWLNYIADNASKVSLGVSHVAKLTHSSNKAINLVDTVKQRDYLYLLTTQTAGATETDSAYTDASIAPVAEFLSYPVEGATATLGEFLAKDERFFSQISDDHSLQQYWQTQIAQAYQAKSINSHVLAKQVYIPIEGEGYHLISPIKSSALAHKVYEKVNLSRSKDNPINQARKNRNWHDGTYVFYPKLAFLSVTKSNHQNASKLNGSRRGGLYFFQSLPPSWKQHQQPPGNTQQFLARCYTAQSKEAFSDISSLLHIIKSRQLSINLERKRALIESIHSICEVIFDQILIIQQSYSAGWSQTYELKDYLKITLDPYSTEHQDLSKVEKEPYIDELTQKISGWISEKIGDKTRQAAQENLWIKIMRPRFREFYAELDAE